MDDSKQADWAPQFDAWLASPLGKEFVNSLGQLRQSKLQEAENNSSESLLNQAYGIRLALEHLQFRAILPKDEGNEAQLKAK